MTMKSDKMKDMPKMSPEQMELMRKKGVNMPQMQNGSMVIKVCMTKEMVERDHPPLGQNKSGCQIKDFNRNGNTYSAKMVCDGPNMKGTATIKGMHSGLENFSWTYDFTGTMKGNAFDMHQEASGKWQGPDCGDVKPASEYSQK